MMTPQLNPKDTFAPAIVEMESSNSRIYGPEAFQPYITKYKLPARETAQLISVDAVEYLAPSLKARNIMVFRLGLAENTRNARFALAKGSNLQDFFLFDSAIFTETKGQTYLPSASLRDLFAYQVLPIFSESSFVNLGLSSGLLSYALGLEQDRAILNPATGHSSFTFKIRLHSEIDEVFCHNRGQVEIDSIFLGRRNGRDVLFVVEAKVDTNKTLAKHKLIYSVLAIAEKVPPDIEIVPVYIRVQNLQGGFQYNVVECSLPDPRCQIVALNELEAKKHIRLVLPRFSV